MFRFGLGLVPVGWSKIAARNPKIAREVKFGPNFE
jgi:hypothetical protein